MKENNKRLAKEWFERAGDDEKRPIRELKE